MISPQLLVTPIARLAQSVQICPNSELEVSGKAGTPMVKCRFPLRPGTPDSQQAGSTYCPSRQSPSLPTSTAHACGPRCFVRNLASIFCS